MGQGVTSAISQSSAGMSTVPAATSACDVQVVTHSSVVPSSCEMCVAVPEVSIVTPVAASTRALRPDVSPLEITQSPLPSPATRVRSARATAAMPAKLAGWPEHTTCRVQVAILAAAASSTASATNLAMVGPFGSRRDDVESGRVGWVEQVVSGLRDGGDVRDAVADHRVGG